MTMSQKFHGSVSRNLEVAGHQFEQLKIGLSDQSPGVSGIGKTAVEFIAAVDFRITDTQSVSRFVKCKSSSIAFVSGVSSCSELSFVAYSPAYRATPKNTLPRVFQNLQRAARAAKVPRLVQRLAP